MIAETGQAQPTSRSIDINGMKRSAAAAAVTAAEEAQQAAATAAGIR